MRVREYGFESRKVFAYMILPVLAVVTLFMTWTFSAAAQDSQAMSLEEAENFIESLGQETIDSLIAHGGQTTVLQSELREIFQDRFHVPVIARFVMGANWRRMDEQQQAEFTVLFAQAVASTYARRFSQYQGEVFEVVGARAEAPDVLLETFIRRPQAAGDISVMWRVRKNEQGQIGIIDVVVEGVSMGITQRNEYAAILQRNNHNFEELFESLRQQGQ